MSRPRCNWNSIRARMKHTQTNYIFIIWVSSWFFSPTYQRMPLMVLLSWAEKNYFYLNESTKSELFSHDVGDWVHLLSVYLCEMNWKINDELWLWRKRDTFFTNAVHAFTSLCSHLQQQTNVTLMKLMHCLGSSLAQCKMHAHIKKWEKCLCFRKCIILTF